MAIFLQHHNGLSCPQWECEAQAQARGLYCRGQVRVGEPIGLAVSAAHANWFDAESGRRLV
jgi:hypothetical protein